MLSLSSTGVVSSVSTSVSSFASQSLSATSSATSMTSSVPSTSSAATSSISPSPSTSSTSSAIPSPTGSAVNAAAMSSKHSATFYIGVILGAIVGFVCIVAFIAWFFRVCLQRNEESESSEPWPWDKEDRDRRLESGLQDPHGLDEGRWPVHSMLAKRPPAEEVGYSRQDAFGIQYPIGAVIKDGVVHGTPRSSLLQGGPLHPALHGTPKSIRTPFVPVLNPHQSVPDLAPDIGRLQVTNHVPGDVSSGDESSRANSRQGLEVPKPHGSTLRVLNRDNGVMMNVPLTPMQHKSPHRRNNPCLTDAPLPFPGQTQRKLSEISQTSQKSVGWAASIRSNIANAFNVVVGSQSSTGSVDQHPASNTANGPASDRLQIPVVRLEHVDDDNSRGYWDDLSAWMSNQSFTPQPPAATPARLTDPYSQIPAALTRRTPKLNNTAPKSPVPPPLCRTTTSESALDAQECRQELNAIRRSQKIKRGMITKAPLTGGTSSLSVASSVSRTSSASSGPLTEQEKLARKVLRERRRRVLGMQGANVKSTPMQSSRIPVSVAHCER